MEAGRRCSRNIVWLNLSGSAGIAFWKGIQPVRDSTSHAESNLDKSGATRLETISAEELTAEAPPPFRASSRLALRFEFAFIRRTNRFFELVWLYFVLLEFVYVVLLDMQLTLEANVS